MGVVAAETEKMASDTTEGEEPHERKRRRKRRGASGFSGWLSGCEEKLQAWESHKKGRYLRDYWLAHCAIFLILGTIIALNFFLYGRSILWNNDGLEQYYPFFIYEGQWLRDVFSSLFSGHGLQATLWEWNLGYGSDVITTLQMGTYNDPINLFSVFAVGDASQYVFQGLVLFRLFLTGVTFSLYALYRGSGRFATLCGALCYTFSATLLFGLMWPGSLLAPIMFPLVLLAAERVLQKKRPYLLIMSIAFIFLSSYYFSYMICLLLIGYCVIRVFQIEERVTPRVFLGWFGRFFCFVMLGIIIAAVMLIPSVTALFNMERFLDSKVSADTVYTLLYYQNIVGGFLGYYVVGNDCFIGYGSVAALACAVLYLQKKKYRGLKIAFAILTIVLLTPICGKIFNGFNYVNNRWVFAYAFCVSYVIVKMIPHFIHMERRTKWRLVVLGVIVMILGVAFPPVWSERYIVAAVILLITIILVVCINVSPSVRRLMIICCCCLWILCNGFYFFNMEKNGFVYNSCPLGNMYSSLVDNSPQHLVNSVDDGSLWRYDSDPANTLAGGGSYKRPRNDSLVLGLNSIDFYNSIYNGSVDQYHTELGLAGTELNHSYHGLNGRSILETLNSVKYYLLPQDGKVTPAYNYDDKNNIVAEGDVNGGSYVVYEGENTLPLGYTYSSIISRGTYDALSPADRQEALMEGVVLDDESAATTDLPETSLELTNQAMPYTITATSGLTIKNGKIITVNNNATMTLTFEGLSDSETYLYFNNLDYHSLYPSQWLTQDAYDSLDGYGKFVLFTQDIEQYKITYYTIYAQSDKGSGYRSISNFTTTNSMYGGKTDWLLNLGYSMSAQSSVTITFSVRGVYSFNNLSVVCQPMSTFDARIDALKVDTLDDVAIGTNEVTGTITLDQEKLLYLSIPYSIGWTAYVDGQEADILKANTAFMAIDLQPGYHEIRLVYMTPGLKRGATISGIGLAVFACGIIIGEYRRYVLKKKMRHS